MYRLIKELPEAEKYNLCSQIRRAATSLTNNIAESHRRFHFQETIQFLRHSRGSLEELMDDLNICIDETYRDKETHHTLSSEAAEVLHRLNGCIAYLKRRKLDEPN